MIKVFFTIVTFYILYKIHKDKYQCFSGLNSPAGYHNSKVSRMATNHQQQDAKVSIKTTNAWHGYDQEIHTEKSEDMSILGIHSLICFVQDVTIV